MRSQNIRLLSFDQSMAVVVAILASVVFLIGWGDEFARPYAASACGGFFAFLVWAGLSAKRLSLVGESIKYESLFQTDSIPLTMIAGLTVKRMWIAPIPQQWIIFGHGDGNGVSLYRIGLLSWPDGQTWGRDIREALEVRRPAV
jgi:hypothetical protein